MGRSPEETQLEELAVECAATTHSLGEGHQDFECWKVHAMLDDPAVENEFRSAVDTNRLLDPDERRAMLERHSL